MSMIECLSLATSRCVKIPSQTLICLGNFDGVHYAHRQLIRLAADTRAREFPNAALTVFCFRTPSSDVLFPHQAPTHLSTLEQKLDYFREEGVEYVFLADFPKLRDLSREAFAQTVLKEVCHCVCAVCGFNYRFGNMGAGTATDLSDLLGAPVKIQEEICLHGETVSSTRIRRLLSEGNVKEAACLLTRPYGFRSKVVHGKALGQTWKIPTMNQNLPRELLIPRLGVYVTECEIDGKKVRGVSNVGLHPTVDRESNVNCETFLLDFSGDLYGKDVTVCFLDYLRPEQKFETVALLREQIACDIEAAKRY